MPYLPVQIDKSGALAMLFLFVQAIDMAEWNFTVSFVYTFEIEQETLKRQEAEAKGYRNFTPLTFFTSFQNSVGWVWRSSLLCYSVTLKD